MKTRKPKERAGSFHYMENRIYIRRCDICKPSEHLAGFVVTIPSEEPGGVREWVLSGLAAGLCQLFSDEEILAESCFWVKRADPLHSLKALEPKPDLAKARISWAPHQLIHHPHIHNTLERVCLLGENPKPAQKVGSMGALSQGTWSCVPKPLNTAF